MMQKNIYNLNLVFQTFKGPKDPFLMPSANPDQRNVTYIPVVSGPQQWKFVDVCILCTVKYENGSPWKVATQSVFWKFPDRSKKGAWLACSWRYDVDIESVIIGEVRLW